MKTKMYNRVISALLSLAMMLALLPADVFSVGGSTQQTESTAVENSSSTVQQSASDKQVTVNELTYVGEGDEEDKPLEEDGDGVWHIYGPTALVDFAAMVNGGETFEGKKVELENNIDMGGKIWTPVGVSSKHPFKGTFDGQNHEVKNFTIQYANQKNENGQYIAEVDYIGFFGYIQNATVQNFGIYDYHLDQTYDFDTEIGALVGHVENSKVTDCYANGDISAMLEEQNPLERDDVKKLTSVPKSLGYTNPNGQGVIIDLQNHAAAINQTMTISGDVSAVRIIGKAGTKYTGFNIVIEGHDKLSLLLELVNVNFTGSLFEGTINCKASRTIYIKSSGASNAVHGAGASYAINVKSELYILGDADFSAYGGYGGNGKDGDTATEAKKAGGDGKSGEDGKTAVVAEKLYIGTSATVYLYGGDAGNGGNGGDGINGYSYSGHSDRNATGGGANGGNGTNGGKGGNGGRGGYAYDVSTLLLCSGMLVATGGKSGDGGDGGKGGNGGKGQEAGGQWQAAGNGGKGGNGGNGGDTYIVDASDGDEAIVKYKGNVSREDGEPGIVGKCGGGGSGGAKGMHCDKANCGQWLTWGDDGSPGAAGSRGYIGNVCLDGITVKDDNLVRNHVFQIDDWGSIGKYDNNGKGVKLERIESTDINSLPYSIKITSKLNASNYEGAVNMGGFYAQVTSSANKVFYYLIRAKVPKGYSIGVFNNAIGDGGKTQALGSAAGTGKYEWYTFKTTCGSSGKFSTLGYVALVNANNKTQDNIVWEVSYFDVVEAEPDSGQLSAKLEWYDKKYTVEPTNLSMAKLTAGGFVGYVSADAKIENCATVVNRLSGKEDDNNQTAIGIRTTHELIAGNFVGNAENTESLINVLAAYQDSTGLYKYVNGTDNYDSWFGENRSDNKVASVASFLTVAAPYEKDSQGVYYDNGIAGSNTVSRERTVQGNNTNQSSIIIPEYVFSGRAITAVTAIGDSAFTYCSNLTTIHCGELVKEIGADIFLACYNLTTIIIGKSLNKIADMDSDGKLFGLDKSTSSLKEYKVSGENEYFASDDQGILYEVFNVGEQKLKVAVIDVPTSAKFDNGIYSPQKKDAEGNIAADNDYYIMRIYAYAFAHNKNLKEVHLDYIRSIGPGAFSNCTGLETVVFGQYEEKTGTVQILEEECPLASEKYATVVGEEAFSECRKLQSVNLDSNALTEVGAKAFYNCATAEGTSPLSISLGKNISSLCAKYDSTADMMQVSFADVFTETKIRRFDVHPENATFASDENGVLFYRSDDRMEGSDKEVRWLAIYPRNAEATGYALVNDEANDYVVTYVSPEAFAGAENLNVLTIGNGVTQVGLDAFNQMTSLHTLHIGKDVGVLGGDIIANLFTGCGALQNIYVDDDNQTFADDGGVLMDKAQIWLIKYPEAKPGSEYTTPDTVVKIAPKAFMGNVQIRKVTLSGSVTEVGNEAFHKCPNLSLIYFATGDCPFASPSSMKDSNAFYTTNPRVLVCYGESDESKNEKWRDVSTEEANATYYSNVSTQGGARAKLFQVAPYTASSLEESKPGYYAFVVVDKGGNRLNQITVSVGDEQSINTINGIAMFYGLSFDRAYELKVRDNMGEFFPLDNAEFYLDEDLRITYITLSSVPTVSGVSVSYTANAMDKIKGELTATAAENVTVVGDGYKVVDINSETAKINTWSVQEITVSVLCGMDPEVHITGFQLVQNGVVKMRVSDLKIFGAENGGKNTGKLEFSIGTDKLEVEQDVYILVDFSTGEQVQTKLNIHIFEFEFYELDMSFLQKGLTFEIDEQLSTILSGFGGELEVLPKATIKFNVSAETDSFKISLVADVPNLLNMDFNVSGEVEIKYNGLDENGDTDVDVFSRIKGTITLEPDIEPWETVIWIIPVTVEVEMSLTGTMMFEVKFDDGNLTPEGVKVEIKGEMGFLAGVGCRYASIGVYGTSEMRLLVEIAPDFEVEKWTLSGDVGFYFKVEIPLVFKLKLTWSPIKSLLGETAEWVIYEDGKWWYQADGQIASISDETIAQAIYNEDAYEVATSSFDAQTMTFALRGIQEQPEDAYASIAPKMVQVGDLVYIVYHNDLNGYSEKYDENNYQKLVYQTYDINSGTFSDVYVLDDNGYADGAFDLYSDGSNAVIVYTQMKQRLDAEDLEKINDEENPRLDAYLKLYEVKTATLNGQGEFVADEALTDDECYDMYPQIGLVDGKITAVWVQNAENTMFGTTENNNLSIYYSVYSQEDGWNDAKPAKENINTITDLAVGSQGIVYITDINNDLLTVGADQNTEGSSDRKITRIDLSGNVISCTGEEAAYHDVSYFGDEIVYYAGNNLYTLDTMEAFFDAAIPELPEDYTVLTSANGDAKAILYVQNMVYDEETGTDGSNVFGIFCDENGQWGAPIQLTDYGPEVFVSSYDVLDAGDKMLISVLLSQVSYQPDPDNVYDQYATTNRFETLWMEYPTHYEMEEVTFDAQSIIPGMRASLTVKITNCGYQTLESVPVTLTRDGVADSLFDGVISDFYDAEGKKLEGGLLSGMTGYIDISFEADKPDDTRYYHVESNDQIQDVQLWYSDFAVYGKQITIGKTDEAGNTTTAYYVVVRVTNQGYLPASYTLQVLDEALKENEEPITTDKLHYGESQYFTIPVETVQNGESSKLITLLVDADGELATTNNEAKVNVTTNEVQVLEKEEIKHTFEVTWSVAGVENVTQHEFGTVPSRENPEDIVEAQYTYKFIGWDTNKDGQPDALTGIIEDMKCVALFSQTENCYDVSWKVGNETITQSYLYGAIPSYDGTPTKASDPEWEYEFSGWDKEISAVTEDVVYTAIFKQVPRKYTVTLDIAGQITTMQVEFGATPVLPTPDNYSDVQYEYTFAGWDREVETVRGNITYVAKFSKSLRQYVVTWDVDGQQTEVGYDYGAMPSYDGIPTKQSNIQFSYSFEGWDKEIANVAGDVTYTAQFAEHVNQYTISFVVDGVTHTEQFAYGSMPEFSGNTAKADDEIYRYVFAGWDKELTEVCGDETYTAQYEAILIGRATAINSAFTVENDGSFTTVISLCDIQNMTSAVMVLYYDITLVTIEGYQCRDGVTVIDVDDGYISMRVDGLGDRESCELLEITFVIGVALNESETEFIGMVSDEMITYAFSKLSKEQYDGGATDVRGDLDLDGDVDAQDLTILARHVAGIEQVTGQALSNADVDNDGDIDANDLTMHARYVAGIITDWDQE